MAGTTGGITPFTMVSVATTNPTQIAPQPAQLVTLSAANFNGSPRFIKFYDTAVTPTSGFGGGTNAVLQFALGGASSGGQMNLTVGASTRTDGYQFSNGIALQITANIALADNSGVGAGDVCLSLGWR